jgi:hypothetical protein
MKAMKKAAAGGKKTKKANKKSKGKKKKDDNTDESESSEDSEKSDSDCEETPKKANQGKPTNAEEATPKTAKEEHPNKRRRISGKSKPADATDEDNGAPLPKDNGAPPPEVKVHAKAQGGDAHPRDPQVLQFPGTTAKAPVHDANSTIYTSVGKQSWRLKLSPGDKHEVWFNWNCEGEAAGAWRNLLSKMHAHNRT